MQFKIKFLINKHKKRRFKENKIYRNLLYKKWCKRLQHNNGVTVKIRRMMMNLV